MSDSEEFDKITNAYQAAVELWKLASQQIYSRFAAMLTGNSIIVAIIGLAVTARIDIPRWLLLGLIIGGFVICVVWAFFVFQGVRVENHYRKKAEEFEGKAIPNGKQIAIRLSDKRYWGFREATFLTIIVFVGIYSVLLTFICPGG